MISHFSMLNKSLKSARSCSTVVRRARPWLHFSRMKKQKGWKQVCTHDYATKSYSAALEALNSLQSNASAIEAIRRSGRGMNKQAIPEMLEWLRRAGYRAEDFDTLNAIHIAGTKGKGSTAAFVSSILNKYRSDGTVGKVGLYTSPHLRFVRERIQINGQPLSEEAFAESFFEIWDQLEDAQRKEPVAQNTAQKPLYFRFLTIMALHTFLKERVDASVVECGVGGEYDSTNILQKPIVTGITSLGIDHVGMLGSTLAEIAWHKAGIIKPGIPIFTAPQPQEAMQVLSARAKEKDLTLKIVDVHPEIASNKVTLGLNGDFQKLNASLAVELAASYLRHGGKVVETISLPDKFRQGLKEVRWPGRCEIRKEKNLTWCIDGAHTAESIEATSRWYSSLEECKDDVAVAAGCPRILLFNQQTRAGSPLLQKLYQIVSHATGYDQPFTHAIFCTNVTYTSSGYRPDLVSINVDESIVKNLHVQRELAAAWEQVSGVSDSTRVIITPTIEQAIKACRKISSEWQRQARESPSMQGIPMVLATGSIHLIGGVIDVLEGVSP